MGTLDCYTHNCKHNTLNKCNAGFVNISEKAVCATKQRRDGGSLEQTYADIEASRELSGVPDGRVVIGCDCDCMHNENFECKCPSVTFGEGISQKTKCSSREKPKKQ